MTVRKGFLILAMILPSFTVLAALFWAPALWLLIVLLPIIFLGGKDMFQKERTILRLYPVIGRFRYWFEHVRPEIQQYFVESDLDGTPVSREFRSLVYQRAKGQRDTRPFGTQFDVYRIGYEWMDHSIAPVDIIDRHPRVTFGGSQCTLPYLASPLNISAMSYGALSKNAIMALNKGAKAGLFAHNTGEGGISPYHLQYGGDLIWQIGTGYFGCRDATGHFNASEFAQQASLPAVKMIELKLSQGAKPGHGGVLPAAKVTREIAHIRHVPEGQTVISPPAHSSFSSPTGLLEFIQTLRHLSGGKPIGFKLCMGRKHEFLAICKAMLETGITPDFITVDGGEGGTGAAPVEFTNSLGSPLRDGLNFVHSSLVGIGLRQEIRIIASGKAFSAFHILRLMALGADTVNSARAMMFALGCVQSRQCNADTCPTGIATQNPTRSKALDVEIKGQRVKRYHNETVGNMMELLSATGLTRYTELTKANINRRVAADKVITYADIYPNFEAGSLLNKNSIPEDWKSHWNRANADHW